MYIPFLRLFRLFPALRALLYSYQRRQVTAFLSRIILSIRSGKFPDARSQVCIRRMYAYPPASDTSFLFFFWGRPYLSLLIFYLSWYLLLQKQRVIMPGFPLLLSGEDVPCLLDGKLCIEAGNWPVFILVIRPSGRPGDGSHKHRPKYYAQ